MAAETQTPEHEQFEQADQEADVWRAREIAKDIAKRKVQKMNEIAKLKAKEERKRLESEDVFSGGGGGGGGGGRDAKLTEAITGGDAITRLGVELESMGLDRMQVVRVAIHFGNKPNQLRIWNGLNDSYKPDFVKAILEE
ncbi:hypothetical protein Ddye_008379 [Dipteronia dyeriana]|uniref:Uncharacterized protein n=1 Tax=Dipteronia dyeriana TaxID=168575 RepID=A0AAD9X9P7_9ROSI|nr:hypothetical protein Ddye_008379 [Dipteronia dyeriana]